MRFRLLAQLLFAGMPLCATPVEIIAHRGASHDAPENTLSAMKIAWEQSADAVELDLWLSKDGRLVVFHDGDTSRFDGAKSKVADLTWTELQTLDVGKHASGKFVGERIPTLESILATLRPGKKAVLEIKSGPEILPALKRSLDAAGTPPEQLVFISFKKSLLEKGRIHFPKSPHYFLHGYKKEPKPGDAPNPTVTELIDYARKSGLQGLNLSQDWPITRDLVSEIHAAGLKCLIWTVNDAALAQSLQKAGVDAITTDRPAFLRQSLQSP